MLYLSIHQLQLVACTQNLVHPASTVKRGGPVLPSQLQSKVSISTDMRDRKRKQMVRGREACKKHELFTQGIIDFFINIIEQVLSISAVLFIHFCSCNWTITLPGFKQMHTTSVHICAFGKKNQGRITCFQKKKGFKLHENTIWKFIQICLCYKSDLKCDVVLSNLSSGHLQIDDWPKSTHKN